MGIAFKIRRHDYAPRAEGSEQAPLLGKRNRGSAGKLDAHLVAEFRRYARQEGYPLTRRDQARHLQRTLYGWGMSVEAIEDILANWSWNDPGYIPGELDPTYWARAGSVPVLLLTVLSRSFHAG